MGCFNYSSEYAAGLPWSFSSAVPWCGLALLRVFHLPKHPPSCRIPCSPTILQRPSCLLDSSSQDLLGFLNTSRLLLDFSFAAVYIAYLGHS
ncbi:hypothetical protein TNCT_338441 [Trichonephila clavata]|uniref:Uncharacterized protein n=1 Tax=Trichonephila clavata TaxID=2740835 RepID=A0A8X6KWN2_TRICU|nr:hypothetical protein TNCT_338441 [Trichonephila clavata]